VNDVYRVLITPFKNAHPLLILLSTISPDLHLYIDMNIDVLANGLILLKSDELQSYSGITLVLRITELFDYFVSTKILCFAAAHRNKKQTITSFNLKKGEAHYEVIWRQGWKVVAKQI